jgi:molecular chaperone GrpE
VTSKGAAHPNRPETAPPSDGGAVSAGTAAGAPVDSGAPAPPGDAVNDQGDHDHASKDSADKSASETDDATATTDDGDSTIDLEVTLASTDGKAAAETTAGDETEDAGTDAAAAESAEGAANTNGKETDVRNGKTAEDIEAEGGDQPGEDGQPFDKELETLRGDLGELTRDLQRITAEYANYRKRVDRDRTLAAEYATGAVLTQLLPVLDDLDRARDHGDLVGPFGSVAEQLVTALTKFGLTAFGAPGDPFDPTLHEAVSHTSSPDVTETTCVEIMRRGYQLGERMLRPALVGVADPE